MLTLVSICVSRVVCEVTMAFVRFALTVASSPADARVAMASVSYCVVARAAKALVKSVTRAWGSVAVAVMSGCFCASPLASC